MNAAVGLLHKYYGLAVRRNQKNLTDMRKAVWTTFLQTAVHINSFALQVTIHGVATREQRQVEKITIINTPFKSLYQRQFSMFTKTK
jgi:hypothetical protein